MGKTPIDIDSTNHWNTVPVGTSGMMIAEAMEIGKCEVKDKKSDTVTDEYCFLGECQFEHMVRTRKIITNQKQFCWTRWEVRIGKQRDYISPEHYMIISRYPHSCGFVGMQLFKKPRKVISQSIQKRLNECADLDCILKELDSMNVDYWETGKKFTAGFSQGSKEDIDTENRNATSAHIHGICKDAPEVYLELRNHERTHKLIEATHNSKLLLKPVNNRLPVFTIFPEVIGKSEDLMDLAIRQAMAGPDRNSQKWINRPVLDWATILYERHIYRHCQKISDQLHSTIKKRKPTEQIQVKNIDGTFMDKIWLLIEKQQSGYKQYLDEANLLASFESILSSLNFYDIVNENLQESDGVRTILNALDLICSTFHDAHGKVNFQTLEEMVQSIIDPIKLDEYDIDDFKIHRHDLND